MTANRSSSSPRATVDKLAIGLSSLCAVHCLLLPVAIVMIPSLTSLGLDNEAFHLWMVFGVLPLSAYALTLGCKKHNDSAVMLLGVFGLATLLVSAFAGHEMLGEIGERVTTLLGATLVAGAHWRNFRLCGHDASCGVDAT